MRFLQGMYVILILFMVVNFLSVFVLSDNYSGVASWMNVSLFLLGSVFYVNARYVFERESKANEQTGRNLSAVKLNSNYVLHSAFLHQI